MGYYDQDYQNESRQKKNRKTGYFFSGVIGAVIGSILVLLLSPYIQFSNNGDTDNSNVLTESRSNDGNTGIVQNVSLDVNSSVTEAYEKAGDAVVGITNIQESSPFSPSGEAGTGSGVVYKVADGKAYIISNHHVIEGASKLEVTLADGSKVDATLLGSDELTDLAVLEIDAKNVKTVAEFGKSSTLKPGEPVIAIGNPLGLQFSGSVTQGIISGLERTIEIDLNEDGLVDWNAEVIQTDAAINPGNSGGALVNMKGQLIGINSMKIAESAVEGIGLAIPIDEAIPIIEDIEEYGEVKRPWLGVSLAPLEEISQYHRQNTFNLPSDVREGVAIISVEPSSPAGKAGIKDYDVIVEMDGEPIADLASFTTHLYMEKQIGDTLEVTVYRNGKKVKATIELQENKDNVL